MQTVVKEQQALSIFDQAAQYEHEQVVFCHDKATGLRAIIAIHDTTLGPAAGGTRMWTYAQEADALHDVLRLSRGMTFKNAVAGLNLGGGKAVILGDARKDKSEFLFRAFGKYVDSLGGRYITAEDVGINTRDIEHIATQTQHVSGKPEMMGGGGDPSPITAYGVYMGMKASAKKVYGNESLNGKRIVVQGAGHVGSYLVDLLAKENANIYIADIYEDRLQAIAAKHKVTVIAPDAVYDQPMDIYAPCALGATINDDSLERLSCAIISGAANNQLQDERTHADKCRQKGILYAPDFLINSGGIINVYYEIIQQYNRERAMQHTEQIYDITTKLYQTAEAESINTHEAALRLALQRIEQMKNLKRLY
ncbi:Glu/Leu/Phe/Val dehydrogenase dimerization domain-containing protein [Eisenibacter elegans]|jgi:leucine dehydrogenase|uniref:Glu/Leu/Phe/Val dehydrogenase dimerization domain-containing protein n=1 Tax=Eisenibacter elegans TaxID=997 RepID=UPI0003F6FEFB|nr:Glu/Leu/Phe/Val dehydrogenase dimerization domain-containing protein [Eisenibacter elegans]